MILKSAVRAYLNRELDDHRWLKDLDEDELDEALDELDLSPVVADMVDQMRVHQKACFLLGVAYPRFAFWLDMGLGKTFLTLALMQHWWENGLVRRIMVFVVSDTAYLTWEKQIKKWGVTIPYIGLEGSSEDKWEQLEAFGDGLIMLHYPGATAMVSVLLPKKKGKGTAAHLVKKDLARLFRRVDGVIIDESTKVGNHTSLQSTLLEKLAPQTHACYALAGRPFGRNPELLFTQQRIVDGGESLGETLGLFRAAFFSSRQHRYARNKHIKEYTFNKSKMPELRRLANHRSITYTTEECIDLPPVQPIPEEIPSTREQRQYYLSLRDQLIEAKGNRQKQENLFLRLRQLSSGFLGATDNETGDRLEIELDKNPKLDRLLELVEELPEDRKAVIWYAFTPSGRRIHEALSDMKIDHIWMWSGTKNGAAEQHKFENKDSCQIAILNDKVGAYSLDGFQIANYSFYYESPVSFIDREQSQRRIERDGQRFKVFRYDLIVKGMVDQRILDFHQEGRDLFSAILKNPKSVL